MAIDHMVKKANHAKAMRVVQARLKQQERLWCMVHSVHDYMLIRMTLHVWHQERSWLKMPELTETSDSDGPPELAWTSSDDSDSD